MEDKIYRNPVRHWLIQGLTLLRLSADGTSELSGPGQPLLSVFVRNYGPAVTKTHRVFKFSN